MTEKFASPQVFIRRHTASEICDVVVLVRGLLAVGPLRVGQRLAINIFLSSVELVQRILTASPSHPSAMGLDFLTYRGQSCLKGSEFV
jgi:hypothetical protein